MSPSSCPTCRKPLPANQAVCPSCRASRAQSVPNPETATQTKRPGSGIASPLPGRIGPYRFLRELGRGGMGRVLEAVDETLGRRVAVKMLIASADKTNSHRRFIEEARITGCLEHPGIAPIYALGKAPDGAEFFSMRLVAGRTLNDILKDRDARDRETLRQYSLTRLLSIFERVVETVAYAHAKGILHRDLKPANIMVGDHGEVWVLDWGLGKKVGSADAPGEAPMLVAAASPAGLAPELTAQGSSVGTPQYMAPEQAQGKALDVRTDVFGLGGVLYRMLTGRPPNLGADYMGTMMAAALGEIPPVPSTPTGRRAPTKLAAIAHKCLAAKPDHRYRTAQELLVDLRAYAAGDAILARPDGVAGKIFRLVRRYHRLAAFVGGTLTLLLVGATIAATMLAAQDRRTLAAERSAQAAEQARQATVAESAARSQRRMRAFTPYAEATGLLMRGQLADQATKKLEEALRIDPEFPEAQFALGEALRLSGAPGRAAPAYLKANELSRQITGRPHLQALLAAGMTYDGAGEYAKSEQCFIQSEREGADHPLALVGKAFRLAHTRKLREARAVAEEALKKAPYFWETQFALGYLLEELARNGYQPPETTRVQAVVHLRKALELSPRQAETWIWLAHALAHSNTPENRAEAIRIFDHAIALEPTNGNRYISRGMARLNFNVQLATADFLKARELGASKSLVLFADAAAAVHQGDRETGFRLLNELVQDTDIWAPHVGNWAALGFSLRKDAQVRPRFDEWCRTNTEYPEVFALKAQLKTRDGDLPGAIAEDQAGLKIAPYNRKLRGQLALHHQLAKHWTEAMAAADAMDELGGTDFGTRMIRGRCLAELGRSAEAKTLLDQLQKDVPARTKEIDDLRKALGDKLPK